VVSWCHPGAPEVHGVQVAVLAGPAFRVAEDHPVAADHREAGSKLNQSANNYLDFNFLVL
jgi:hypothetical protein